MTANSTPTASESAILTVTERGLYCPPGDFFIDPWQPVPRAVITHAHSDHARWGCDAYLTSAPGLIVLRRRLGPDAHIDTIPYGESVMMNGVRVSLHPAGHILGSAQVRIEYAGEVWAITGDYKRQPDPTCTPFEPLRCHGFVTESTFGLPIYRWPQPDAVFAEINRWWRANADAGKASLLYGYTLGKAQRLLAGVDPSIGPIYTHGAVEGLNMAYRAAGITLPLTHPVAEQERSKAWRGALVIGPPSAHNSPWSRKFGPSSSAFASGWMRIRGTRRRRAYDRGFVLSDHVDWPDLLSTIRETGASQVWVTHGYTAVVARYLSDRGYDARAIAGRYGEDEAGDEGA